MFVLGLPRPPITHAQCRGEGNLKVSRINGVNTLARVDFWGSVGSRLPCGRFGVSRNALTLFREIKSAIRAVLVTLC